MKSVITWLSARWAEPSTRAGLSALLGSLAASVGAMGGGNTAVYAILAAAALAALSAMAKADPKIANYITVAAPIAEDVAPIVDALAPKAAPAVNAVTAELEKLAQATKS